MFEKKDATGRMITRQPNLAPQSIDQAHDVPAYALEFIAQGHAVHGNAVFPEPGNAVTYRLFAETPLPFFSGGLLDIAIKNCMTS